MMVYKTTRDWNGFKKGDVVPTDKAELFLSRYRLFEHQDILERVEEQPGVEVVEEDKDSVSIEVPEEAHEYSEKPTKKTTKKKSKK